jgi:hypothetical protein
MEVDLNSQEHTLYSRLYVSDLDLSAAAFSLALIIKKRWHHLPWEKRGSIYQQQAAYTTSFIVSYARPFNSSFGWPKFPKDLIPFSSDEWILHKEIIDLRNSVVAHSDSKSYLIRPWRSKALATDIVSAPILRITADQGLQLAQMIHKLQSSIHIALQQILPK